MGGRVLKRPLTAAAQRLRRDMTPAERKMWTILRNRQFEGLRVRRQAPIGPYIADFACFEPRLVIEVDGGQHGADVDGARDAYLESQGYQVLRF